MSKVLVIVDVQKDFDKFIQHDLVDELYEYAKKFKQVYQIWDTNDATKPTYKFPNQVGCYSKRYGSKYSDFTKNVFNILNQQDPNAKKGKVWGKK